MPVRIRVRGRYEKGHSPAGLINLQSIWDSPHWEGQRSRGYEEIIFALAFVGEENPRDNWYLYRRALEPKLDCFSPPEEREEWKQYIDEASIVIRLSQSEAVRWFDRNGLDLPSQLTDVSKPAVVDGGGGAEWVSRSEAARRFSVSPSTITKWVEAHPEIAENNQRGSRVNLSACRQLAEQKRASNNRDEGIRDRARQSENRDAQNAAKQLEGGEISPVIRRR